MTDAAQLHRESIIIDGLVVSEWSREVFEALHAGGLTAINATVAVWEHCRDTMDNIAAMLKLLGECGDLAVQARSAADIRAAKQAGKVGVVLGFQNTTPVEDDLDLLSVYHALGVRVIQMTYNQRNYAGNGCYERVDGGLSEFGLDLVREMNRLGILIDFSHVGDQTVLDTIEASEAPVAFTHANPRMVFDHPRNKTDAAIRTCCERGGVIGVTFYPNFLPGGAEAPIENFVDVVRYAANLVGVDHVAFGSDFTMNRSREWFIWLRTGKLKKQAPGGEEGYFFSWPMLFPAWIATPRDYANITAGLVAGGFSPEEAAQIMGGNWLRLFGEVWGG